MQCNALGLPRHMTLPLSLAVTGTCPVQFYKQHELKALWEFVVSSGAKLLPIGAMGPLPGTDVAMQLDWSSGDKAAGHFHQSAA